MTTAAIFGLLGPELSRAERDFFRSADPWGFILFARNVETPEQLRRLTGDLRDSVGREAVITIDQEGGRVQRLRGPHWLDWQPPLDDARLGAEAVGLRYRIIARELRALGIDSNCAPTLDLAGDATHPFLRNRCLGARVEDVVRLGRAAAEGMLAEGVLPVMKHLPGHGRATADSHKETPVVTAPLSELRAHDFAPFKALNDLPMGMSAHIRFTAIDDAPATQSRAAIDLIREEIGFDGLLMTDDINMSGLSGEIGDRSARAIAAGCDLVLHCHGDMVEMQAVAEAAGPLRPDAARRAEAALARRTPPAETPDLAQLLTRFRALGGEVSALA